MNSPRLKVLRVIARLNVGGPARQAALLHRELRARGFDTVLAYGSVGDDEASLENLLDDDDPTACKIPELGRHIRPLSDVSAFLELLRLVFRERPDIVHTHTAKAGTLGRVAAALYNATRRRSRRCLVVHTFHGHVLDGYFGRVGNIAVQTAERVLARLSDCIVTISPAQRKDIVERFRVAPAERVVVVRLGLDLDPYFRIGEVDPRAPVRDGLARDAVVFGCIGRLVPIKDVGTLIHAVAAARETSPSLHVVVVGDGGERPALEGLCQRLGVSDQVRFVGWRQDLPAILAGLDGVVLSSRNEGTPVALIEAMAAARPTVATAVGGVPDVVTHEQTGLLVPPAAPAALATALVRLCRCAEERRRLGTAGRQAAVEYRQEHLVARIDRVYRTALATKRGIAV
jgi:glycosyltransferase involved in cell wall biosynthesis